MSATRLNGVQIRDGSVQRVDLDTVTSGLAVITKATSASSARLTISSTGADAGTGDVTFDLATTGYAAGSYVKVTTDVYGRVIGSSVLSSSDIPDISATYVLRSGSTMSGQLIFAASTNSWSSFRIQSGSAPTTPVNGDVWNATGSLKFYDGTGTRSFAFLELGNTWSAKQTFFTSTTASASINIPNGTSPTTPVSGDFWNSSNTLQFYDGTSTKTIANLEGVQTFTGAKTFTARTIHAASTTAASSINIPHGVTPTSPTNGDVWTTTSGMFVQINAATVQMGTVRSVDMSLPNIFGLSGNPITTTGTLTVSLATQPANTFFAGPNGSAGTPTFRVMVGADLASGSAYYIQNQSSAAQATSNAWVSGFLASTSKRLYNGTFYTALVSAAVASNITFTLPLTTGTSGYQLVTDGTGVTTWVDPAWIRTGSQVNQSVPGDKVTIGSTTNNAGALGVSGGSIQLLEPANVLSLIHFNGSNGSRQVVDLVGNRWTSTANPTAASISTAQSKFGGSSMLFNGTTHFLEAEGAVGSFTEFNISGSSSFTVEAQVFFAANTGTQTFCDFGGNAAGLIIRFVAGTGLQVVIAGTTFNFAWSPAVTTWYHVALVRNGTSLAAYVNGAQIGTTQTSSAAIGVNYNPTIGALGAVGNTILHTNFFNGYMNEFRYSNVAVWTAPFIAPTAQYDHPTYTQLAGFAGSALDAGFTFVSDGKGNATLQSPRRTFIAEFALTEAVSNTTAYFYSWRGQGGTQDNGARSGNANGIANANSCSPILVPFNGRITKAVLIVKGAGVNNGSVTYPCNYQVQLYRVGWSAEHDPTINGGSPVVVNMPLSSGVGTFSVGTTNAVVERNDLAISVTAGDKLGLKFVNAATATQVGLTL